MCDAYKYESICTRCYYKTAVRQQSDLLDKRVLENCQTKRYDLSGKMVIGKLSDKKVTVTYQAKKVL